MKYLVIFLATFFSLMSIQSHAESFDTKDPRWKQLSQAYGFALAQQDSLERIERKFPDLAKDAKEAWLAYYSSALGESTKTVEKELIKETGEKWPEINKQMKIQLNYLNAQQEITHTQAVEFLNEVRERSKGQLPKTLLKTLLSSNPRYLKNPASELAEGWKQTFQSKGLADAKGVDCSISLPASWSRKDGNRPDMVQMFQSGAGHGPIISSLMVMSIPPPKLSKKEQKDFFTPSELKSSIPDGGKFIMSKNIILDGAPGAMVVYDITQKGLETTTKSRVTHFVTIHNDNKMILLQFMAIKFSDNFSTLDQIQKLYLPTFKLIASSLVFNDRF